MPQGHSHSLPARHHAISRFADAIALSSLLDRWTSPPVATAAAAMLALARFIIVISALLLVLELVAALGLSFELVPVLAFLFIAAQARIALHLCLRAQSDRQAVHSRVLMIDCDALCAAVRV